MPSIVIVGAGECGGRAALDLRERGFEGDIVLLGAEELAPYERPPLSKDLMISGGDPRYIADTRRYAERDIDLRTGLAAVAVNRRSKTVELSNGTQLRYDKLLFSTGARPRPFPGLSLASPRIFTLRSHADAIAIKGHLAPGARIAIVGGGFIGLELAAVARGLGASVTLVEGLPRLLSRGVPPEIAQIVAARHVDAGVRIICGARIDALQPSVSDVRLKLADGQRIEADVVVVGIGSLPNIELAVEAGIAVDNGIAVDGHLRTSDPDMFAAGDCCSFPLDIYDGRRVRLESWRSAQEQASLAAGNLLGADERVTSLPWFWSDQYDLTLQVAGLAEGATQSVRRDLENGAFIIFESDASNRLLAASGIGVGNAVARDIRLAEMLIAKRSPIDPTLLASPDVKLKSLLGARA